MFPVPEKYIPSVRRELIDADIRTIRFHHRNYPRPFPCMRLPTIDDELCARIDCIRRVFSMPEQEKGMRYCTYECMYLDGIVREKYLCKKCWIFPVTYDISITHDVCKRINVCNRCLSTSPCFCAQCRYKHVIPMHVMRAITPDMYYREHKRPTIEMRTSM